MYFFLLSIKETDNYYSIADEILACAQEMITHTHTFANLASTHTEMLLHKLDKSFNVRSFSGSGL